MTTESPPRRRHAELEPCPYCQRLFLHRGALHQHERSHTNTRPYACFWPGCGYRATQRGNLNKHLRCHTPPPPPSST